MGTAAAGPPSSRGRPGSCPGGAPLSAGFPRRPAHLPLHPRMVKKEKQQGKVYLSLTIILFDSTANDPRKDKHCREKKEELVKRAKAEKEEKK